MDQENKHYDLFVIGGGSEGFIVLELLHQVQKSNLQILLSLHHKGQNEDEVILVQTFAAFLKIYSIRIDSLRFLTIWIAILTKNNSQIQIIYLQKLLNFLKLDNIFSHYGRNADINDLVDEIDPKGIHALVKPCLGDAAAFTDPEHLKNLKQSEVQEQLQNKRFQLKQNQIMKEKRQQFMKELIIKARSV